MHREKHREVFRCKLGSELPALVEPMKLKITHGTKSRTTSDIQYIKENCGAISKFMELVVQFGFMRKNANAARTAAQLLIIKSTNSDEGK